MRIEAEKYVKNYKLLWDIVEEMTLLNFELLKSKKPQPEKCESPDLAKPKIERLKAAGLHIDNTMLGRIYMRIGE